MRKDENTLHKGGRRLAWTVATVLSDAVARGSGNRSERAEFRDAVARAVENTPYTVEDAKKGFIVHLDIVDARWWTLFAREGLASSFSWRVYERGSSFTIYDRKIPDAWSVGVPRLAGPLDRWRIKAAESWVSPERSSGHCLTAMSSNRSSTTRSTPGNAATRSGWSPNS